MEEPVNDQGILNERLREKRVSRESFEIGELMIARVEINVKAVFTVWGRDDRQWK